MRNNCTRVNSYDASKMEGGARTPAEFHWAGRRTTHPPPNRGVGRALEKAYTGLHDRFSALGHTAIRGHAAG